MSKREPTENRQRQIADAALSIVAKHGLSRLTTAAIAQEVGLTEGAIFRHFGTKEEIVLAAIDRIEELFEADAASEVDDPLDRLRRFIEHRVRVAHENSGIPRLIFSDELSSAAGERGAAKVQGIRKRAMTTIRKCLEEAKRRGQIPGSVDLDAAVLLVQGSVMVLVFNKHPKNVTSRVWETLRTALGG